MAERKKYPSKPATKSASKTQRDASAGTGDSNERFARARYYQAVLLMGQVLAAREPADQVMEKFFRANRQMGSKDRGFAAETVYACLRRRREFNARTAGVNLPEAARLVAAAMVIQQGWAARSFAETDLAPQANALITAIRQCEPASLSLEERCNLPDWLAAPLRAQLGDEETEKLARALNEPAPVDLRINTRRFAREDIQRELEEAGYACAPTPFSPWGLRREQRGPLFHTEAFKRGAFELQDEASQLVAWMLAPKPKQTVVDYCAGAGGKTLHIADLMNNRGSVFACDIAAYRLDKMKPRLVRAQLDNVRTIAIEEANYPALRALLDTADAVLVDAPCSGSGTLRRNPDMKWREVDIDSLAIQQREILGDAAQLVKPGGRLVYATCSVLQEENDAIVDAFLAAHPDFEREPVSDGERDAALVLPAIDACDAALANDLRTRGRLALFPHRHQTDGFFAQRLKRKN